MEQSQHLFQLYLLKKALLFDDCCYQFDYLDVMVNLFAYRATNPGELKVIEKPIGYKNNYHIKTQCADADIVIAAWGNHGTLLKRDKKVQKLLKGTPLKCFKLTSKGQPAHPLYQPKDISLIDYE